MRTKQTQASYDRHVAYTATTTTTDKPKREEEEVAAAADRD